MRACAECKQTKPLSEFFKTVDPTRCKACVDYLRGLNEYVELFT